MVISKNRSIQKGKKIPTATAAVIQVHGQHGFFPLFSLGAMIPEDRAAGKRKFLILSRFSLLHKSRKGKRTLFVRAKAALDKSSSILYTICS